MVHAATWRRTGFVIAGLFVVLGGFVGGIVAMVQYGDPREVEHRALWLAAAVLPGFGLVVLRGLRRHRWTITAAGVQVEEGPRVPFTGRTRRADIRFADIAALERVESGLDREIVLVTRAGRRHVLPAVMRPGPRGFGVPDLAGLQAFLAALVDEAARAGIALPVREGLSFWNRAPGLALLGLMLAFALAVAGATAWALWDGLGLRANQGQAAAIFLLLPPCVAWLLWRSLRRRQAVLRRRG